MPNPWRPCSLRPAAPRRPIPTSIFPEGGCYTPHAPPPGRAPDQPGLRLRFPERSSMNPLRLFKSALVLAVGLGIAFAAPAFAQRVNAPGTYDASVVYIPGISVPGGLPEC